MLLIVEDNALTCDTWCDYLHYKYGWAQGLDYVIANNAVEAMLNLGVHDIKYVVLDHRLGGHTGEAFAWHLHNNYPQIKVVRFSTVREGRYPLQYQHVSKFGREDMQRALETVGVVGAEDSK